MIPTILPNFELIYWDDNNNYVTKPLQRVAFSHKWQQQCWFKRIKRINLNMPKYRLLY